jgi:hypothetical protein
MRALDSAELLDLWERGLPLSPTRRALALLAAACPEASPSELAAMPLGRRNAHLLALRELLLGPELTVVAPCPACGEHLESTFHSGDMRSDLGPEEPVLPIEAEGYRVAFRLPSSEDLLALGAATDRVSARDIMLERCLLGVERKGEPTDPKSLPEPVVAAVAARMAAADPAADIELALSCPCCRHGWHIGFDVAGFFWQEIHAWAKHMLRGVHALARAYGWREADVLALTSTRRRFYLELARQ